MIAPEEGKLQIEAAWYGTATNPWQGAGVDCHNILVGAISPVGLYLKQGGGVKNKLFGDPAPGSPKLLAIKYKFGHGPLHEKSWAEHASVYLPAEGDALEIAEAWYGNGQTPFVGGKVCTNAFKGLVTPLGVNVHEGSGVLNGLCGDPAPGVEKVCIVRYRYGPHGPIKEKQFKEREGCHIPPFPNSEVHKKLKDITPSTLKIVRAWYGNPSTRWGTPGVNCSSIVTHFVNQYGLFLNETTYKNNIFGDPAPGVQKELAVEYQYGGGPVQCATFGERQEVHIPPHSGRPEILQAWYGPASGERYIGGADVTGKVQALFGPHGLFLQKGSDVMNRLFGDTAPGQTKALAIRIRYGGGPVEEHVWKERDSVNIPPSKDVPAAAAGGGGGGAPGHAAPGHAAPGHAAPGHAPVGHAAPGHGV